MPARRDASPKKKDDLASLVSIVGKFRKDFLTKNEKSIAASDKKHLQLKNLIKSQTLSSVTSSRNLVRSLSKNFQTLNEKNSTKHQTLMRSVRRIVTGIERQLAKSTKAMDRRSDVTQERLFNKLSFENEREQKLDEKFRDKTLDRFGEFSYLLSEINKGQKLTLHHLRKIKTRTVAATPVVASKSAVEPKVKRSIFEKIRIRQKEELTEGNLFDPLERFSKNITRFTSPSKNVTKLSEKESGGSQFKHIAMTMLKDRMIGRNNFFSRLHTSMEFLGMSSKQLITLPLQRAGKTMRMFGEILTKVTKGPLTATIAAIWRLYGPMAAIVSIPILTFIKGLSKSLSLASGLFSMLGERLWTFTSGLRKSVVEFGFRMRVQLINFKKSFLTGISNAFSAIKGTIGKKMAELGRFLLAKGGIFAALATVGSFLFSGIKLLFGKVGGFLLTILTKVVWQTLVKGLVFGLVRALGSVIVSIGAALVGWPVLLAGAVIGAIVGIGYYVYKNWDTIKAKFKEYIADPIVKFVDSIFSPIKEAFTTIIDKIEAFVREYIGDTIGDFIFGEKQTVSIPEESISGESKNDSQTKTSNPIASDKTQEMIGTTEKMNKLRSLENPDSSAFSTELMDFLKSMKNGNTAPRDGNNISAASNIDDLGTLIATMGN